VLWHALHWANSAGLAAIATGVALPLGGGVGVALALALAEGVGVGLGVGAGAVVAVSTGAAGDEVVAAGAIADVVSLVVTVSVAASFPPHAARASTRVTAAALFATNLISSAFPNKLSRPCIARTAR
jgi:hypothetical protein